MSKIASKALCRKVCALLLGLLLTCTTTLASEQDGAELYERHCASCHRPLAKTLMFDRSPSRIRSAVQRFAVMRSLRTLSDAEIAAIAAVLATPHQVRR